ncbi:Spy/CpxP family protein refolding chaperone [Oceanicoccus sagamiensis]|uniref:Zinc resistance-associated protein n=1 Tax=Oceanicoccus sagamiensis TaxID=716816 RepID=A0A1X9NFI1_9GAMM|nr:Spy/CpxP family protein refolding chaperone [Oceanicoccus sagamiensis]ARN72773.1 hypothetical protein BST96_00775 [Oceanicoccus sagamiensis]
MKLLISAILIALFSLSAVAGSHSDKSGDHRMEKMIKKLDLNEQQEQQVRAIMDSNKAERKAIREQMQALRDKTNQELSKVLTGEQMDKLTRMQEKRKDKKKDKKKDKH